MRSIEIPDRYDFVASVATTGVGRMVGDAWVWTSASPSGPGTIEATCHGTHIDAHAWGPGAEDLLDRLPMLVGLETPAWEPVSGPLRELWKRTPGLRIAATGAMHDTVGRTVFGQKVTTREAKASLRGVISAFGIPGQCIRHSDVGGYPEPSSLADLLPEDLHQFGLERRRASIVIEVARRAQRIEEARSMEPQEALARLQAVQGVGPWTAGFAMGAGYGWSDAVPTGDFHLPNTVSFALAGEARGDDERMLELLEPYRPFRWHAIQIIKRSGIRAPRYGPKTATRTHL